MAVDSGSIYSDVRIRLDKLNGDIKSVKSQLGKVSDTSKTESKQVESNYTKAFKGVSIAGVAAFAGITMAMKKAVSIFAKTEQSLANVKAVSGATEAEFRKLEDAALAAGETTRFTAGEAASALYYLASAGFDAKQSIAALDGVLYLAGATGSDLAKTSETVASSISAFNLEASDSTRIANLFAAAIGNSQATMDKLSVSMRYVAPVASAFNQSIEGTVGLLQILYNNGFEASQAGTALRSSLSDLSNAASPANDRLAALGVTFAEVNPQTNSYAEIIDVLSTKVTDASDIMAIFGDRAGPAMIKLIEAGKDTINEYTEAVTGTNAAAEQYAIQNDTLAGSTDKFKSAAEGLAIKLTAKLSPAFRGVIDLGAKILNFLSKLPGPLQALVIGFSAVEVGVLGLTKVLPLLGIQISAALAPIGLLVAGITGIGLAINESSKGEREFNKLIKESSALFDTLDGSSLNLITELAELQGQTNLTVAQQQRQFEIAEKLKKIYPELTDEILANAQAIATEKIETAKLNKVEAERKTFQLNVELVKQNALFEKQSKTIRTNLIGAFQEYNLYKGTTIEEEQEFQKLLADTKSYDGFLKIAKSLGKGVDTIGLQADYTQDKINTLTNEIDEGKRAIAFYSAAIGTSSVALATLEKNTKSLTKTESEVTIEKKKAVEEQKEQAIELVKLEEKKNAAIEALEKQTAENRAAIAKKAGANALGIAGAEKKRLEDQAKEEAKLIAELELLEKNRVEVIAALEKQEAENKQARIEFETRNINQQNETALKSIEEKREAEKKRLKAIEALEKQAENNKAARAKFEQQNLLQIAAQERKLLEFRQAIRDELLLSDLEYQDKLIEANIEANKEEAKNKEALLDELLFANSEYQDEVVAQNKAANEKKIEDDRAAAKIQQDFETDMISLYEKAKQAFDDDISDKKAKILSGVNAALGYAEKLTDVMLDAEATAGELAQNAMELISQILKSTGNAYAVAASVIIDIVNGIISFIDDLINQNERLAAQILEISNDTNLQLLDNLKTRLDQEYELEREKIDETEKKRLDAYLGTLSAQEVAALKAAGAIEETTVERIQRQLGEAIAAGDTEKANTLSNYLEVAKIKEGFELARETARKAHEKAVLNYEYKRAVIEKQIRVAQMQMNKEEALSELPWYSSSATIKKVTAQYDALINAVSAIPLPPVPMATGGIILPQPGGVITKQAENDYPEMDMNLSPAGMPLMEQFADVISSRLQNNSGTITINLVMQEDVIAKAVVRQINNGIQEVEL